MRSEAAPAPRRAPASRAFSYAQGGPFLWLVGQWKELVGQWKEPATTYLPVILSRNLAATLMLRSSASLRQPALWRLSERHVTFEPSL